jgi:uncharacterized MAPEG superfamily protein
MSMFGWPVPSILLLSIAIAFFLVYFPYLLVAVARFQVGFDLGAPRATFDTLPPYGKRASWAHQNSIETFAPFAAAALAAYVTGVDSTTAGWAAIAFIVARFLFSVAYIANVPPLRSLMFGIGTASTITLFVSSITQSLQS